MNFVTGLSMSARDHDALLVVTDTFTKAVALLLGRADWTAEQWAAESFRVVFPV